MGIKFTTKFWFMQSGEIRDGVKRPMLQFKEDQGDTTM